MLNLAFSSLLITLVCCDLIGYVSRCPTKKERRIMDVYRKCPYNESYHCIRNEKSKLVETCNKPKLIPKGNFPYYLNKSDDIFYKSCPKHLYQPLTVWSSEICDCEYQKTSCNGIGKVFCDSGNTTNDAKCGCDYKKGYVMNGQNKCCSPSSSNECFCHYFTCKNELQELDKDFKCINMCLSGYERSAQNTCDPKTNTNWSAPGEDESSTYATTYIADMKYWWSTLQFQRFELMFAQIYHLLMIMLIFIYGLDNRKQRMSCMNFLHVIGIMLSMAILLGIASAFTDKNVADVYVFTLVVIVSVFTTCYLVYTLSVIEMITDPEVYNEEYDKRIFRLLNAASMGDIDEIKRLIYEDYIDVKDVDINGRSALHLAVCENQRETVDFIVKHDLCFPAAKDRWGMSALDYAALYSSQDDKHIFKALKLHKFLHSRRKKRYFKETKTIELETAARKGDIRTIKRLAEMGTDMNLANAMGRTALHAAVENGFTNIVDYLIDVCDVSPFIRYSGKRPIEIVPTTGKKETETNITEKLQCYMSHLLEYSPEDVYVEDQSSDVMLVRFLNCASRGDIKQMKRFKASGYKMDVCNYDLQTALHIAVMENQEHIVEFLLTKCNQTKLADTAKNRWNVTPWEVAKTSALQSVKYVFFDNCPETLEKENDDMKTFNLFNAATRGDLSTLESLHKEDVDMNKKDHNGKTALHFAASAKQTEAVTFLVDVANVDSLIPDRYNRFPMDEEMNEETKNIITKYQNALKEKKMELKMSAREDLLVLVMKASFKGILHKQTDPRYKYFNMESCDDDGDTPLHKSAAYGNLEDVIYLLDRRRACLFVRNNFWKRPIDLVEEALIFWKQRKSQTHNKTMIIQLNKIKDLIVTAMHKAMDQHVDIEEDAFFAKRSQEERLFLFQNRIFKGDILTIRRFLKTDATLIDQLDYYDRTALHIAAAAGHTHLVEFLIEQGAKTNKKDRYNVTPFDEAKMNGDDEMQHMLKD